MNIPRRITQFRPHIRSRHPSHNCLRSRTKNLPLFRFRTIVRLGSITEVNNNQYQVEINSIQSIKNSSNKLLMKEKFLEANVRTADWNIYNNLESLIIGAQAITETWSSALVAKAHYGSKGRGNTLIHNEDELVEWSRGRNLTHYLFEKFMNYGHEFRLHVSEDGCFYACRKALKADAPQEERWRRHDDICVWLLETNENFHKPNSWDDIILDCVNALKAIGADLLSFDVRVQTPTTRDGERREYQDFILLECNSASSMDNGTGELSVCAQKYIEEIPKIIIRKANG